MDNSRKLFSITTLAFLLAVVAPLAQGEADRKELRESMRLEALKLINRDRVKHGLRPVALDPFASSVADAYCESQIRNKTTGHFTTDGLAPYMRYSFAGGNDGVSENAAAWSANYTFPQSTIPDMIRRSHDEMMLEVPPHDGHRRTILDPHATHVGIGLFWEKGEFRFAHEFVRRYLDWSRPLAREAREGDRIRGEGRPLSGYAVNSMSVYFEPEPQGMSPFVASSFKTYGLPSKRLDVAPALAPKGNGRRNLPSLARADQRLGDFVLREDGSFLVSVPTTSGPGVYTIVVWAHPVGSQKLIAASNVSIRVSAGEEDSFPILGAR
jgi:uncharacterized protein YkwD